MKIILSYNVCIRRESGYCAVEWGTMPSDGTAVGQFSVSEDYPSGTPLTVSDADLQLGDGECSEDFVVIPQGTLTSATVGAKDRYTKINRPDSKFYPTPCSFLYFSSSLTIKGCVHE